MQIEIVSFSAAGEDEIAISVELCEGENSERRRLVLPSSAYADMRLCRGECSEELYDAIESESKIYAAYKRGLYILGFGTCSERMLVSKLISKGFDKTVSRAAVARLSQKGFISEGDGALREAERCVAKLWGASRIRAHLSSKGYGIDAINKAMFALDDAGVDFLANCIKLIDTKCKVLPSDRGELQKLIASICRYGYSLGEVKAACTAVANRKKSIYDI